MLVALAVGLVTAPAADTNKTLRVELGKGKIVEMSDTSDATRGLDLSKVKLELLYEADFAKPLKFVKEADLFANGKRTRKPEGAEWVLEGKASARVENGRLVLKNDPGHLVFSGTRASSPPTCSSNSACRRRTRTRD